MFVQNGIFVFGELLFRSLVSRNSWIPNQRRAPTIPRLQIFWGRRKGFGALEISEVNFTNKFPIPTNSMSRSSLLPHKAGFPPSLHFPATSLTLQHCLELCFTFKHFSFLFPANKIELLRWFCIFSKYHLKCHLREGKRAPSPSYESESWLNEEENLCKMFLQRS